MMSIFLDSDIDITALSEIHSGYIKDKDHSRCKIRNNTEQVKSALKKKKEKRRAKNKMAKKSRKRK